MLLHGAGVWTAGDRRAGYTLIGAEGVGLLMMAAGGLPIIWTHASGQHLDVSVTLLLAGIGLVLTSFLADIYGGVVGGRPHAWQPRFEPYVKASLGYAYVRDPQFSYNHFSTARIDGRLSRFRVSPEAWVAMDDDYQQLTLEGAVRITGPQPRRSARDGTFVDFQLDCEYQRFGSDDFSMITVGALLPARLDLSRVGPSLAGSFVLLELGWAFQTYDFGASAQSHDSDVYGVLRLRMGVGTYLGRADGVHGEVTLYYDHRRDEMAGGLPLILHEPNFLGYVGATGEVMIYKGWGARLEIIKGTAFIGNIGVVYTFGETS